MADQPKRDRVADVPDEGIPAFETVAPATHEDALRTVEAIEALPQEIAEKVARAAGTATPSSPTGPGNSPAGGPPASPGGASDYLPDPPRVPSSGQAGGAAWSPSDDADLVGSGSKLLGALGQLPGMGVLGQIAGAINTAKSIADAVQEFQDHLDMLGGIAVTPRQQEREYQQNLAKAEADPAHKQALADAEAAIARTKRENAERNARSTVSDYLPTAPAMSAEDIPYQPDLPAGLAAPPRISAPDEPAGIPGDAEGLAAWYGALPPAPKISSDPEADRLRANLEMEKLRALGMVERPRALPANEHDMRGEAPAWLPPGPPVQLTPRRPLLSDAEQAALLGGIPPPAPQSPEAEATPPEPSASIDLASIRDEFAKLNDAAREAKTGFAALSEGMPRGTVPQREIDRYEKAQDDLNSFWGKHQRALSGSSGGALPESPALPPPSPAAPFLPEAPPTAAPDADNWLERMALAVSHFGDAVKDSTGLEMAGELPKSMHMGKDMTRDEGEALPKTWREEADDVMTDLAALAASHGPRSSRADGEDRYRVPGFSPLREVLPPHVGPEPLSGDEAGLGMPVGMPAGRGADMQEAAEAMMDVVQEFKAAVADFKSASKEGRSGRERREPMDAKGTPDGSSSQRIMREAAKAGDDQDKNIDFARQLGNVLKVAEVLA